jgi:RNA polymerase sigma-70 factor, ECF subfamily
MSGDEIEHDAEHDDLPVEIADPPPADPEAERAEDEDTAKVVARFQKGDTEVFSILYARYFGRVFAYMRLLLNHVQEAEDATQDIFILLMKKLPSYKQGEEPFRAWLFVVARNHAIDILRRSNRLDFDIDWEEALRRSEAAVEDKPTLKSFEWINDPDLFRFVERLPLVQRQILALRFMLDMPQAEIAAVLGLTHSNVRSLHHRALRFLNARLTAVRNKKPGTRTRTKMRTYKKQAPVLRSRRWSLDP